MKQEGWKKHLDSSADVLKFSQIENKKIITVKFTEMLGNARKCSERRQKAPKGAERFIAQMMTGN